MDLDEDAGIYVDEDYGAPADEVNKGKRALKQRVALPELRYIVPQPAKFNGSLDNNITCARTWLTALGQYLEQHKQDFVARFPLYLQGDAQKWAYSLYNTLRDGGNLDEAHVRTQFLLAYGDMLTPEDVKARQKLEGNEWRMKTGDKYSKYVTNFRTLMREAGEMAVRDQIFWFLHGLTPTLKKACMRQANGKPWDTLDGLIEYGVGQAEILHATNADAVMLNAMYGTFGRGGRARGGRSNGRGRGRGFKQGFQKGPHGGGRGGYGGRSGFGGSYSGRGGFGSRGRGRGMGGRYGMGMMGRNTDGGRMGGMPAKRSRDDFGSCSYCFQHINMPFAQHVLLFEQAKRALSRDLEAQGYKVNA
jgi:hypothetical protein